MSKPSVLHAVDELDKTGFYNNSTLLGDVRTTPTLLDTVLDNGIYTFIGGTDSPNDNNGNYKWCLRVYSSDDRTSTEHIAERYILNDDKRKVFVRSRSSNTWTSWVEDAGGGGVFIVTYNTTTCDEITAARNEGKAPILWYEGYYVPVFFYNITNVNYTFYFPTPTGVILFKCSSSGWATEISKYSPISHASTHATGGSDPITPEDIGAAASSHNQAASTITAGTFNGQVVANATAVQNIGIKQVRNIYAGTADMTSGTTELATGDIYIVYE